MFDMQKTCSRFCQDGNVAFCFLLNGSEQAKKDDVFLSNMFNMLR